MKRIATGGVSIVVTHGLEIQKHNKTIAVTTSLNLARPSMGYTATSGPGAPYMSIWEVDVAVRIIVVERPAGPELDPKVCRGCQVECGTIHHVGCGDPCVKCGH